MRLPWRSGSKKEAHKESQDEFASKTSDPRQELFRIMVTSLPEDSDQSAGAKESLRSAINGIEKDTVFKAQTLILNQSETHPRIALAVWDALGRRNPDATLNQMADNFEYMEELGWGSAGAMVGLVVRAFPNEAHHSSFTSQQQQALIRLEDSRWNKLFEADGGSKSEKRKKYDACVFEAALAYPHQIEHIISIADERKPTSLESIEIFLVSDGADSLRSGEL